MKDLILLSAELQITKHTLLLPIPLKYNFGMLDNEQENLYKEASQYFGLKGAKRRWGVINNPPCPYCDSLNVVKNSIVKNTQRFRCKDCKKYFSRKLG